MNNGGLFFIDGPGGTGKTFVENLLLAYVRSKRQIALAVASSGIASLLLDGGRTAHSRFKIPIELHSHSQCSISAQSHLAQSKF
jgi:ATP-dependent DNA helicase PIF1